MKVGDVENSHEEEKKKNGCQVLANVLFRGKFAGFCFSWSFNPHKSGW